MTPGDWLAFVALLTVQGGGIVAFLLRIESRLTRLEAQAEAGNGRRVLSVVRRQS